MKTEETELASQPWARHPPGAPPDRAFFENLFEEARRDADAREERFLAAIASLPYRWFGIWLLLSLITSTFILGLSFFLGFSEWIY